MKKLILILLVCLGCSKPSIDYCICAINGGTEEITNNTAEACEKAGGTLIEC